MNKLLMPISKLSNVRTAIFSQINALKTFGGRAPPRPAGGARCAPQDPLAGFEGPLRGSGMGKREGRDGKERILGTKSIGAPECRHKKYFT